MDAYLFDYDEVIVKAGEYAGGSMVWALEQTFGREKSPYKTAFTKLQREQGIAQVFRETTGTTEAKMFLAIMEKLGIEPGDHDARLYNDYVDYRLEFLLQYNKEHSLTSSDQGRVCPDFLRLVEHIRERDQVRNSRSILGIITGNPFDIITTRVPPEILRLMDLTIGGDSGLTRSSPVGEALLQLSNRQINHVVYFDDSHHAIQQAESDTTFKRYRPPVFQGVLVNRKQQPVSLEYEGGKSCRDVFVCHQLDDAGLWEYLDNPYGIRGEGINFYNFRGKEYEGKTLRVD